MLHPVKAISAQEIYDFVKVKVIRYKWLDGGIQFVNAIPKNPVSDRSRKFENDVAF
jgi:hypothetical protein